MKKVLVKGWVEDYSASDLRRGHHSIPVRFKCEDGSHEWLWVRKNNVSLCQGDSESSPKGERK